MTTIWKQFVQWSRTESIWFWAGELQKEFTLHGNKFHIKPERKNKRIPNSQQRCWIYFIGEVHHEIGICWQILTCLYILIELIQALCMYLSMYVHETNGLVGEISDMNDVIWILIQLVTEENAIQNSNSTNFSSSAFPSVNEQRKPNGNDQFILLHTRPFQNRGACAEGPTRRRNRGRRPGLAPFTNPQIPQPRQVPISHRFLLLVLELEHENGVRVGVVLVEEPVVKVPRDLHVHAVDYHALIAAKLPLQALNLQHLLSVHAEREFGVVPETAIDLNLTRPAAERCARGVDAVGEDVLFLEEEQLRRGRLVGPGLRIRVSGGVAKEEAHVAVNHKGNVETRNGFRVRPEFGFGKVPEEDCVRGYLLHAVLFPEDEGSYVELIGDGIERLAVELNVERATHYGAWPREGHGTRVCVVDCDVWDCGVRRRGRRRRRGKIGGGGGAEAGGKRGRWHCLLLGFVIVLLILVLLRFGWWQKRKEDGFIYALVWLHVCWRWWWWWWYSDRINKKRERGLTWLNPTSFFFLFFSIVFGNCNLDWTNTILFPTFFSKLKYKTQVRVAWPCWGKFILDFLMTK